MRVTIIRDDGLVGIGGTLRLIDLSRFLPESGRYSGAAQKGMLSMTTSANTPLDNVEYLQPFIDLWTATAAPPPSSRHLLLRR